MLFEAHESTRRRITHRTSDVPITPVNVLEPDPLLWKQIPAPVLGRSSWQLA